jgi:heme a synthase
MTFHRLALFATVLAFLVILLGAFTRLSHAGLGCPDWPGCYGNLFVPETVEGASLANEAYPERPLEASKAWKEMIHRYFAGTLGLLIGFLCVFAWRNKESHSVVLPTVLVGIVIFQAALGMWTVTLLLKPLVVMTHLLFGFLTFSLLFWLTLDSGHYFQDSKQNFAQFRLPALFGIAILFAQIALGGWTSSNYAALACYDLPTCQEQWWPPMDFKEAFVLWRGLGIDYEGGVLDDAARTAIHMTHRIGSIVTLTYLLFLSGLLLRSVDGVLVKKVGFLIGGGVLVQFGLGLSNVFFSLPLSVATAHNGMAALLLLSLVLLNWLAWTSD